MANKPRHILFLQSSSEGYGSGKIILQVIQFYQKQGLSPVVLLTNHGPIEEELTKLNIPFFVHNLGILRRKYVSPLGLINRIQKNLKAYRFLSELHHRFSFELVYSNTLAVVIGAIWAKRNKLPHIWHIHEILPGPLPLVKGLASLLEQSTPNPIAVSQAVADHWQPLLKKSKLEVIHNGIPYRAFFEAKPSLKQELGIPSSRFLIGMVGRINPGKGQLFFLQIAEEILKSYADTHFVLVGDPFPGYEPILEEIKTQIQQKGLERNVSYLGFRDDIPEVMASLDIFMLPSILPDSFPTVVLEAMASSKPVIATKSGGASEMVVNGETGILIQVGDIEEGVRALETLLSNHELSLQMGKNGQERVLQVYSLESFEQKITAHLWRNLKRN